MGHTIIAKDQNRGRMGRYFSEIWRYRDLLYSLVVRDLKARYKNSVLGILWSLFNPLLMMLIFTWVFTVMLPHQNIRAFPVFFLCGLLPWNYFTGALVSSTASVVNNAHLIKKVYFPREVLPISAVLSNLVHFLIALIVLFALMLGFRIPLSKWLLLLPLVILIQTIFISGMGLILSTVNVFYRDVQHILEVLLLAWFFLTPIFYPIDILPRSYQLGGISIDVWRLMRIINPMASIIATYRDILYWGRMIGLDFLARTALTALGFLVIGLIVFHKYSPVFAEEV